MLVCLVLAGCCEIAIILIGEELKGNSVIETSIVDHIKW